MALGIDATGHAYLPMGVGSGAGGGLDGSVPPKSHGPLITHHQRAQGSMNASPFAGPRAVLSPYRVVDEMGPGNGAGSGSGTGLGDGLGGARVKSLEVLDAFAVVGNKPQHGIKPWTPEKSGRQSLLHQANTGPAHSHKSPGTTHATHAAAAIVRPTPIGVREAARRETAERKE
jgi:hypothetical protein